MIWDSITYINSVRNLYKYITVSDRNILITGATGLIGSVITDAFCLQNKEKHTGNKIFVIGRNLTKLEKRFDWHGEYKPYYVVKDMVSDTIPSYYEFDYIINAASNADPQSYAIYPVETILTNTNGTQHILDYCKTHLDCRVLLLSTFEVYGKHDNDEYCEEDFGVLNQNSLRSGYPESKRVAELLVKSYYAEYNVKGLIARLPSVYGPTMIETDNKAHAEFLRAGIQKKDIILKSSGAQKRTYCYVFDVVSGILKILFNGMIGESYNIANPLSVVTIKEFAEIVAKLSNTNVVYTDSNNFNHVAWTIPIQNCILNSDKLKMLGWTAEYDIYHGIGETLKILTEAFMF